MRPKRLTRFFSVYNHYKRDISVGLLSVNWLFHRPIVIPEVESGINQRGNAVRRLWN